jgi:hypothetical protein
LPGAAGSSPLWPTRLLLEELHMEIKIDAVAVQDAVVRAITDSAIGEQIKDVIEKHFTGKERSWDTESIMEKAIKGEVQSAVTKIIYAELQERKDEIRQAVLQKLTDKAVEKMAGAAIDVMLIQLDT